MSKTKRSFKSIALIGILLVSAAVINSGCGSQTAAQTQSQTSQSQSAASTQQGNDQNNPGTVRSNPAVRAALEVVRLQKNSQTAFTSDQITKLKPLLQSLVDASDPTTDFLQTKADAITAVFTDAQKSAIAQQPNRNNPPDSNTQPPSGSTPPANSSSNSSNSSNSSASNSDASKKAGSGTGNRPANMDPKTVYQQALDALK